MVLNWQKIAVIKFHVFDITLNAPLCLKWDSVLKWVLKRLEKINNMREARDYSTDSDNYSLWIIELNDSWSVVFKKRLYYQLQNVSKVKIHFQEDVCIYNFKYNSFIKRLFYNSVQTNCLKLNKLFNI